MLVNSEKSVRLHPFARVHQHSLHPVSWNVIAPTKPPSMSIEICDRKNLDSPATLQLNTPLATGSDSPNPFLFGKTLPLEYCSQYQRLHLHDDRDPSNSSTLSSHILMSPFVGSCSTACWIFLSRDLQLDSVRFHSPAGNLPPSSRLSLLQSLVSKKMPFSSKILVVRGFVLPPSTSCPGTRHGSCSCPPTRPPVTDPLEVS